MCIIFSSKCSHWLVVALLSLEASSNKMSMSSFAPHFSCSFDRDEATEKRGEVKEKENIHKYTADTAAAAAAAV